jgi:hypothetical protein
MLPALVLACCLLGAWGCTNTSSLYNESYVACMASAKCSDAFYLTPDHHFWERQKFDLLLNILLSKVQVLDWSVICNSTQTFEMWMVQISWWDFCLKNEVFSELTGDCVCRRDKNCDQRLNGTVGFATASEWILLVLLSIAFVYFVPTFFNKISALQALIEQDWQGKTLAKMFNH